MRIRHLSTRNFRLLDKVDIEPSDGINLIVGDNAAGKTSLLETIVSVSRGRVSGGSPRECCGRSGTEWWIEILLGSDTPADDGLSDRLHMQWYNSLRLKLNDQAVTARSLSRQLVVAAIDPHSHQLFDFGPSERRRFLDWALFHVEPNYAELWSRWRRILEQRNSALAMQSNADAAWAWDALLVEAATAVHHCRKSLAEAINKDLGQVLTGLFDVNETDIRYSGGWNEQEGYGATLKLQRNIDQQVRRTRSGPQKADLSISLGGIPAERLSRGQQKLLLSGLMICACFHVAYKRASWPVLLLDDFESELGVDSQNRLASALSAYPGQSFVTQHRQESVLTRLAAATLFHVEHGDVSLGIQ